MTPSTYSDKVNCYVSELWHDESNAEISEASLANLKCIGRGLTSVADLKVEGEDDNNLKQFLYCVATVNDCLHDNRERLDPLDRKPYSQAFVAADLVHTTKGGGVRGSKLKDFISDHLNICGASDRVKRIVSSIGL